MGEAAHKASSYRNCRARGGAEEGSRGPEGSSCLARLRGGTQAIAGQPEPSTLF